MSLPIGSRLGPYQILGLLGAGGMGEVYKARDTRLDRLVAIKVLPPNTSERPEVRQRFEREARAVSALNHPHIWVRGRKVQLKLKDFRFSRLAARPQA